MSIETAPHPLYAAIMGLSDELEAATQEYGATAMRLVAAEHDRRNYARLEQSRLAAVTAEALNDPTLGTNDKQRSANLALRIAGDTVLATYRHDLGEEEELCRRIECLHKNAYHLMETLRVRLAALTALVQGGTR